MDYNPQALDELQQFLAVVAAQLADGARPAEVQTPRGQLQLDYGVDQQGREYAEVPYRHCSGAWDTLLADGACGQVRGWRYYPD
jgi:hypothetical protein